MEVSVMADWETAVILTRGRKLALFFQKRMPFDVASCSVSEVVRAVGTGSCGARGAGLAAARRGRDLVLSANSRPTC